MRGKLVVSGAGLALLAFALWVLTDRAHRRVGRRAGEVPAHGRGAIVVLGLPGSNPALRAVQRWRVELALAAWEVGRCDHVVFTGGATRGRTSEARQMAALAVARGLDPRVVRLEEGSRSTRENVDAAARLVGPVDFVVLASDALHAERARSYWRKRPDAPVLILADGHRSTDRRWLRVPVTLRELAHARAADGWPRRRSRCLPEAVGRP